MRDRLNSASPVLIAWGTPWIVHSVGAMAALHVAVLDVVVDEAEVVAELHGRGARQRALRARRRSTRRRAGRAAVASACRAAVRPVEAQVVADHLVQPARRRPRGRRRRGRISASVSAMSTSRSRSYGHGHGVACECSGFGHKRVRRRSAVLDGAGAPDGSRGARAIGAAYRSRPCPSPRRYVTDAIVLSRFDLGEADRVLTLITPDHGKLKAIAKGVRRPTSRLGGVARAVRRAQRRRWPAAGRSTSSPRSRVGHAWLRLRDCARERGHRLVPRRAGRPQPRGAPRGRAAVRAPAPRVRAARRGHGARARGALVRDAPGRRAGRAPRGGPLRRVRPDARGRRDVPLGAAARRRAVRAAARARRRSAPGCRSTRSSCSRPTSAWTSRRSPALRLADGVRARGRGGDARLRARRAGARRPVAGVPGRGPIAAARGRRRRA